MKTNLRSKIAKLASDKPELRKHLVPLLKTATSIILPSAVTNFMKARHRGAAEVNDSNARKILARLRKVKTLQEDGSDFYLGEFKDKKGDLEDIALEKDHDRRGRWFVHFGYSMGVSSFLLALDELHFRYDEF